MVALGAQRGNHPRQALQAPPENFADAAQFERGRFKLRSTYISSIEIFSEAGARLACLLSRGLDSFCLLLFVNGLSISPMTSTQILQSASDLRLHRCPGRGCAIRPRLWQLVRRDLFLSLSFSRVRLTLILGDLLRRAGAGSSRIRPLQEPQCADVAGQYSAKHS